MTVYELIETLKNYPGDMRVLTLGYEGGLHDIYIKTDSILFDVNSKDTWYYGPHDYVGYDNDDNHNDGGTECLIVGRGK